MNALGTQRGHYLFAPISVQEHGLHDESIPTYLPKLRNLSQLRMRKSYSQSESCLKFEAIAKTATVVFQDMVRPSL